MFKRIDLKEKNIGAISSALSAASPENADVEETVLAVINDVKSRGDDALCHYAEKFDGFIPENFLISDDEIDEAFKNCEAGLIDAMERAAGRVREFHKTQLHSGRSFNEGNLEVQTVYRPVNRAGCYVPGGRASYPSTVLMTVIPAVVAGVSDVVICTPPGEDGKISPAVLVAARMSGVSSVYAIGGAQAISAMAYGTESIPAVDVIVGPGNIYVATAQRMVSQDVGIAAAFAGPSEIVVIADETANPKFAAIDLIVQAEHGPDGQSWLISPDEKTLKTTLQEVEVLVDKSKRRQEIMSTFDEGGFAVLVKDLSQAFDVANTIAPEHLQLMIESPENYLSLIQNAGAVFMGNMAPASVGDYYAGPSHVLPTDGSARFASAL
ncbi:MAG: histidinol dehydrogenase, partial [Acidimicrobiaceae bacterium]|nr:histidinol dehydrogenase [Acidimicrobiaceae bacterium]